MEPIIFVTLHLGDLIQLKTQYQLWGIINKNISTCLFDVLRFFHAYLFFFFKCLHMFYFCLHICPFCVPMFFVCFLHLECLHILMISRHFGVYTSLVLTCLFDFYTFVMFTCPFNIYTYFRCLCVHSIFPLILDIPTFFRELLTENSVRVRILTSRSFKGVIFCPFPYVPASHMKV